MKVETMRVWQSVKAIGDIERAGTPETGGQAGIVRNAENLAGGEVDVQWDVDGETETVRLENLQALN